MKHIELIKVVLLLSVLVYIGRCRSYKAPRSTFYASDDIRHHDINLEAVYNVLEHNLAEAGVVIDRTRITEICYNETLLDKYAGVYNTATGEIYIATDIEDLIMLYWVMAHEVLHSQGVITHDNEDTLMTYDTGKVWWVILTGQSVNEVVIESYKKHLK